MKVRIEIPNYYKIGKTLFGQKFLFSIVVLSSREAS